MNARGRRLYWLQSAEFVVVKQYGLSSVKKKELSMLESEKVGIVELGLDFRSHSQKSTVLRRLSSVNLKQYVLSSVKKNKVFRVIQYGLSSVEKNEVFRVMLYGLSSIKKDRLGDAGIVIVKLTL